MNIKNIKISKMIEIFLTNILNYLVHRRVKNFIIPNINVRLIICFFWKDIFTELISLYFFSFQLQKKLVKKLFIVFLLVRSKICFQIAPNLLTISFLAGLLGHFFDC